jgi:hypothetical protein
LTLDRPDRTCCGAVIVGRVRELLPIIRLDLIEGERFPVEALLDTRFEGKLALPLAVIRRLGVAREFNAVGRLDDGAVLVLPADRVAIEWLDGAPLLGSTLREQCRTGIDRVNGGARVIELFK